MYVCICLLDHCDKYVCMYVCMYVCNKCMYECMYVCMYGFNLFFSLSICVGVVVRGHFVSVAVLATVDPAIPGV